MKEDGLTGIKKERGGRDEDVGEVTDTETRGRQRSPDDTFIDQGLGHMVTPTEQRETQGSLSPGRPIVDREELGPGPTPNPDAGSISPRETSLSVESPRP